MSIKRRIARTVAFPLKTGVKAADLAVGRPARRVMRAAGTSIEVPKDLESVTCFDPGQEVDPADADLSYSGVQSIWRAVENMYASGMHPAIFFTLRRNGKKILDRAIGHASGNGPGDDPWGRKIQATPQTPACLFSASHVVASMCLHKLAEQGKIDLKEPVASFIPDFAKRGKGDITLENVMSHHASVPALPRGMDPWTLLEQEKCVEILCRRGKPVTGGQSAFRPLSGGYLMAEILARQTGKDIREFVALHFQKPLGFSTFNFGVDQATARTVARNYRTGPPVWFPMASYGRRVTRTPWEKFIMLSNDEEFLTGLAPGVNFIATADEMCRFFQMLLNLGQLDGERVFEPSTIRRAVTGPRAMALDRTLFLPMRYSRGLMLGASPIGMFGSYTQHAFGYWGFSYNFCWADPARNTTATLLATGKPIVGPHLMSLVSLLGKISWHCRGKNHLPVSMNRPFPRQEKENGLEAMGYGPEKQRLSYDPNKLSELSEKVLVSLVHEGERLMSKDVNIQAGKTPHEVIYTDDLLSVYRYKPITQPHIRIGEEVMAVEKRKYKTPLVFIPPLLAPGYAFDLYPERSMARYFVAKGFDVFLVDFGEPKRKDAGVKFEHYIATWMPDSLAAIRKATGQKELTLYGYCMGGLFCLLYTGLFQDRHVKNLVTVASPVDMHQMGAAGKILSLVGLPSHKLAQMLGFSFKDLDPRLLHVPGLLGTIGFNLTNPLGVVKSQVDLLVNLWDRNYLVGHDSLGFWINNLLDYPGSTIQEILVQMALGNKLGRRGAMTIGEKEALLENIQCPLLAFAGENDEIVPRAAAEKIMERVGSRQKDFRMVPGGHVGVIIGNKAVSNLWEESARWLARRSG